MKLVGHVSTVEIITFRFRANPHPANSSQSGGNFLDLSLGGPLNQALFVPRREQRFIRVEESRMARQARHRNYSICHFLSSVHDYPGHTCERQPTWPPRRN